MKSEGWGMGGMDSTAVEGRVQWMKWETGQGEKKSCPPNMGTGSTHTPNDLVSYLFYPILFTHEQCNHNFTLSGSPSYTGRTSIHSPTLQSRITIHQHLSPAHSPQQQISFNTVTEWVTYDTCANIHTWSTNFWSINFLARLGWKSGDSKNRRKNS